MILTVAAVLSAVVAVMTTHQNRVRRQHRISADATRVFEGAAL
jgi:cell division protein FtsL